VLLGVLPPQLLTYALAIARAVLQLAPVAVKLNTPVPLLLQWRVVAGKAGDAKASARAATHEDAEIAPIIIRLELTAQCYIRGEAGVPASLVRAHIPQPALPRETLRHLAWASTLPLPDQHRRGGVPRHRIGDDDEGRPGGGVVSGIAFMPGRMSAGMYLC